MAQQLSIQLVDDFDGKPADETVTFAIDGRTYEIDLTRRNAKELRDTLQPYVDRSRRAAGSPRARRTAAAPSPSRRRASSRKTSDAAAIRVWAAENKVKVPARAGSGGGGGAVAGGEEAITRCCVR